MRYLLLATALLAGIFLQAQTLGDYEEVIYLKNGSVIRGIIIEQVPGKSYKIQTHEKNLLVYQYDEVEKITREFPNGGSGGPGRDGRKEKGFNMYIDEGMALWISGDPYPMNILTAVPGYKINRTVFIGAGVGLIARKGFASVPVMIDTRFTFTKTKAAPLLNLQAGYMTRNLLGDNDYFDSNDNLGGFIVGIKPGLGVNLKKDVDLNFYTGYQLGSQMMKGYYDDLNVSLMHFFTLTAGIKF